MAFPRELTRDEVVQILAQKKRVFKGVSLEAVVLRKPTPLDFSGAVLESCEMQGLDLSGLSFRGATIKWCSTSGAKFNGTDFTGATITESIDHSPAKQAIFKAAQLKGLELSGKLQGADFTNANLEGADFMYADLTGATFRGANLVGAGFLKANLTGADFTGAKLGNNDFTKAKLTGAIGLVTDAKSSDTTLFQRITPEGAWIIAIPQEHAAAWKGGGAADGFEGKVTVASYIEMGSLAVGPTGASRALVFEGEYDTGFVPTADGGVFIRGGEITDISDAQKLVARVAKRKGWKRHVHALTVGKGGLALFDSAYKAAKTEVIEVPLKKGTYAVDVLGASDADGSAMAYVRLTKS